MLLALELTATLDVHVDETVITVDRHHVQQLFQLGQGFFFDVRNQVQEFTLSRRQLLVVVVIYRNAHQLSNQTGGYSGQPRQAGDLQLAEHRGLAPDDRFRQRVERDGRVPVRVSQHVVYWQYQSLAAHLDRDFVVPDHVAHQVVFVDHEVNRLQYRLIQLDDIHS
ncbi:hypothetical protein D3C80_1492760 [compost metagenome]